MFRQVSSSKMTLLILVVFCVGIHSAVFQETDEIQDGGLAARADVTVDDAGDSETAESDDVSALKFGRGWRCFPGKSCYFIHPEQRFSWASAKTECSSRGGKLATIDDAFEDAYLREFARLEGDLWIGFNDQLTLNFWRWDNGSSVNYFNWYPGRPSTSSSTRCAYMRRVYNGQWYDSSCTNLRGYICEKRY
ncbi:galactose-specific lectin nattectin-like [Ptychodera flava]|uniref:galactose-specific lectin nattectin-like n=1 Tax=Ptychodera flava TaxID=63121 RepID=UPI00396A0243